MNTLTWTDDAAEASGYTNQELAILYEVAERNKVPAEAILRMIRLENAYYDMGRRRGLFPDLQEVISNVADEKSS